MRYLFEDCALDIDRRELHRGPKPVSLEPQVFDLLVHLIRHRDRVVSKDDLLDTIWKGRVVSELALFNRINAARKAIGDTGDRQRLIKTLPRKGLRFVGEVREEAQRSLALPDLPLPDRPSIAVLPFADTSGDPGREYFADGISEDLVTGLARIRWLFVIARNSTFATSTARSTPSRSRASSACATSWKAACAAPAIGCASPPSSSMRTTGGHLWAERYERELGDIFAVQDDITRSVAAAIEPRLLAAEGIRALTRSPQHLGAWELVAQAQTHFWRMSRADHRGRHRAPETGHRSPSRLCAGARPARLLPGVRGAHGLDGRRARPAGRPRARHTGDRARRLRSLGTYRAGLLGDDGAAHGGVDRGVQAGGEPQSQFRCGPLPSQPGLRLRRPRWRGDRARKRSDPAQSARSRDGPVPGRHCRRPLHGRPLRQGGALHDRGASPAPGLSGCAAPALRQPRQVRPRRGSARLPGRRCAASSRGCRSIGSAATFPIRRSS